MSNHITLQNSLTCSCTLANDKFVMPFCFVRCCLRAQIAILILTVATNLGKKHQILDHMSLILEDEISGLNVKIRELNYSTTSRVLDLGS